MDRIFPGSTWLHSFLEFTAYLQYARYHARPWAMSVPAFVFVCLCPSSYMQLGCLSRPSLDWSCSFLASEIFPLNGNWRAWMKNSLYQWLVLMFHFPPVYSVQRQPPLSLLRPVTPLAEFTHYSLTWGYGSILSVLLGHRIISWTIMVIMAIRGILESSWSEEQFPSWSLNSKRMPRHMPSWYLLTELHKKSSKFRSV